MRYGRKPLRALFVVAARGGTPHRISPWRLAELNTLDWSPDGSRLLISLLPPGSETSAATTRRSAPTAPGCTT